MTYTGNLFGKIGRKFIPLKLTAEDVDRMQAERDRLRTSSVRPFGEVTITRNGYIEKIEAERDQWKAEAERWRGIVENTTP